MFVTVKCSVIQFDSSRANTVDAEGTEGSHRLLVEYALPSLTRRLAVARGTKIYGGPTWLIK